MAVISFIFILLGGFVIAHDEQTTQSWMAWEEFADDSAEVLFIPSTPPINKCVYKYIFLFPLFANML